MSTVRPGYKQTEVGVIPEDWGDSALADFKPFITSGSRGWAQRYSEAGDLFVRITNLTRETIRLDLSDTKFVTVPADDAEAKRTALKVGDLLVSITADIGIIGYVDTDVPAPAYINQHVACVRLDDDAVHSRFVAYFLASAPAQQRFRAITDVGAKTGINLTTVGKLRTAVPPLPEQQAIAEALGDADALIEALEALIAKKRAIKQGAMQDLLTGTRRLPGFQGEWVKTPLGQIGSWRGGATPSMKRPDFWEAGTIPWVSSADVRVGTITATNFITEKAVKESSTNVVPAGAILLVTRSGILRRFLPVAMTTKSIAINQDIKALVPTSTMLADYVFHAIVAANDRILSSCMKSGTTVESIELVWLKRFEIDVPPTIDEQRSIAAVLSDMDAEIAPLEAKLAKVRDVKQGMMQVLLTGEIRLA